MRKQTVEWIENVPLLTLSAESVIAVSKGGLSARQKIALASCQKIKMGKGQFKKSQTCDESLNCVTFVQNAILALGA